MANITKDQVIEFISNMSVLEMSELVKEMEDKFGVSAAAAAAAAAAFSFSKAKAEDLFSLRVLLSTNFRAVIRIGT